MRDLKTLWEQVFNEFKRLDEFDKGLFLCHVIENVAGNKYFHLSESEQKALKEDLYSRPDEDYKTTITGITVKDIKRQRSCIWRYGDNESRLNFIENRIKQLS